MVKGTHRSEFGYDGFGHRVEIHEFDADANGNWVSSTDTKVVWEGAVVLESRSADGSTTLQRYFDKGFLDADGTALYYTLDAKRSVRELVDSQGVIRARYDYDPWGRVTQISGDRSSPFLYTGQMWHALSGLMLTPTREYDPNLGRWISRDPIEETGGQNVYAYVLNNPIRFSDPFGLDFWDDFGNASAGFGDGIFTVLTLGYADGSALREMLGIKSVNKCSKAYQWGRFAGKTAAIVSTLVVSGVVSAVSSEVNLWMTTDHAFFSGMSGEAAASAASADGATVLPNTGLGQALTSVGNALESALGQATGRAITTPLWRGLSYAWAATAGATANVYLGQTVRDTSIWLTSRP
ncbi:MAG: RHS repeat-associated core domain-containing protein [Acidobacteria bacterium]|nr:RHS repeat-associated core domain-containing protein [Acidobacteriota bacterium]